MTMLLEYEAKEILHSFSVAIPKSSIISNLSAGVGFDFPLVLKSQVPVGGRGKLGGIKVVDDQSGYEAAVEQLFSLPIKGYIPSVLLVEELLDIQNEYYLSVLIDRSSESIKIVANINGGVEVEDNDKKSFLEITIDRDTDFDAVGQRLADYYDLTEQTFVFQDLIEKLVKCFKQSDATLIEINPLVLTAENKLIAADCKITLDQSASFRHKDWQFEQTSTDNNFVTLDSKGIVATIANGAGLAMATVDEIASSGLSVANFLDIGGGANEASVLKSFEKIMEYENVRAIVINIFAGITRCDEVAKAIINASKGISGLPPLYIRLAGTNSAEANKLLDEAGIAYFASLPDCVNAIKRELS